MIDTLILMILNVDQFIGLIIQSYGMAAYAVVFAIIFCETGLVFTPFLPGDSLIFILGAFAAKGYTGLVPMFIALSAAAILGDTVNYWIGKKFGSRLLLTSRLMKKEHVLKAESFFQRHGGKTIIIARFVPIVRTFAPFVAGIGSMKYRDFLCYNVLGGLAWVGLFITGGYLFGAIPLVQDNLSAVIIAIIIISFIPAMAGYLKHRISSRKGAG
jgi:membrane-associated protein